MLPCFWLSIKASNTSETWLPSPQACLLNVLATFWPHGGQKQDSGKNVDFYCRFCWFCSARGNITHLLSNQDGSSGIISGIIEQWTCLQPPSMYFPSHNSPLGFTMEKFFLEKGWDERRRIRDLVFCPFFGILFLPGRPYWKRMWGESERANSGSNVTPRWKKDVSTDESASRLP